MNQDIQSLQPWQIFCSMFAVFWLVSAWLDQVLITLVLCIVFGVISDIVTKNMYSDSQQEDQTAVVEKKEVDEISVEEIKANNEKIWLQAEAEKEKEDTPPPLPNKDYQSGQNIDSLADKLTTLAAKSGTLGGSDGSEEEDSKEEEDVPRQYNRTVSDEYNQNTSTMDFNNRQSVIQEEAATVRETIEEEPAEIEEGKNIYAKDSSDEEEEKKIYAKDSSDEEDKKIYAKDSSDDDDYDYASREVNFDESETEEEADDTEGSREDVKEDKKYVSHNAMGEIENELTLQEPKDLLEDKINDAKWRKDEVKLVNQDVMQDIENELKLDESKKEPKDDMLSTFEDLKQEANEDMKSVDDLVTF